jgi:hypothetical protein
MRKAFGYEGCPVILVPKSRPKKIEPIRTRKPRSKSQQDKIRRNRGEKPVTARKKTAGKRGKR